MYLNGSSYVQPSASTTTLWGGPLSTSSVFTVEGWFNVPGAILIAGDVAATSNNNTCALQLSSTGIPQLGYWNGGTYITLSGTISATLNTWNHVAWVVTGGSVYFYVNGVPAGSSAIGNSSGSPGTIVFGGYNNSFAAGWYSNLRICKAAVYTGAFTPSTSPLTTTSQGATNCTLLTFQNNRFLDNSSTAATFTLGGTPSVQPFSPFLTNVAYTPTNQGGSGYFDGTGDYLSSAPGAIGTSDFTIEVWVYPLSTSQQAIFDTRSTSNTNGTAIHINASAAFQMADGTSYIGSSSAAGTGRWYHLVMSRTGGNQRLFVNGVLVGSPVANSTNYSTNSAKFGADGNGGIVLNGYISGAKLTIGSGVTSVAVPTAPPSPTGATLCLNFTNAGIVDSTAKNVLETVGNAQISTAVSKWGGSSIYIPGTVGSYVFSPSSQSYNLFGADMTIEGWLYPTSGSLGTRSEHVLAFVVDGSNRVSLYFNGTTFTFWTSTTGGGSGARITSTAISVNTQSHFALVKQGSTFTLYVNGVSQGTSTTTVYPTAAMSLRIGTYDGAVANDTFTGYIDDLRISKFARYTGNFTVPQAQFAYNQADINVKQWVPTNFSVTAGVGNDSLVDSPTWYGTDTGAGGEVRGNYCTLNPLDSALTLANGNLQAWTGGASWSGCRSTFALSSGKWYWEFQISSGSESMIGVTKQGANIASPNGYVGNDANGWGYSSNNGQKYLAGASSAYGATWGAGDIIGIAFDADAGSITCYKNNVSQGVLVTGLTNGPYIPSVSFATYTAGYINFGQRPFAYAAPSGFKALCSTNLPTPAIGASASTLASKNFNAVLWTGNGTNPVTVSGVGFQPDVLWGKSRSNAYHHRIADAVRGVGSGKMLYTSLTDAEGNNDAYGYISSFNSDGFVATAGATNNEAFNTNAATYVGWAWNAGGSTVTNTNGSISSQVRANAAAGISVIGWTSTGSNGTIGHGLGAAPAFIIARRRNTTENWLVYHKNMGGNNGYLLLNSTAAFSTGAAPWNSTDPTSTVFSSNNTAMGAGTGNPMIAYAFAEVAGFSKFGSYTGNGNADGPFVYCGFRPKWVMIKNINDGTSFWLVLDAARDTYNVTQNKLAPNSSEAENGSGTGAGSINSLDFLSNGFKLRTNYGSSNTSGQTYIFAAFAEAPFQYSRAR